jgi:hypothetical protein
MYRLHGQGKCVYVHGRFTYAAMHRGQQGAMCPPYSDTPPGTGQFRG